MTVKELASQLNGRELGGELFPEEERDAKDAGLVVVFSYSDDNMEFRGVINDEFGCYNGGTAYLTKSGLLRDPDCDTAEDCDCPYFATAKRAAKAIKAVWHDEGNPCWTYETDIPHETFNIYEDGELICVGIVFSAESLMEA